MRQSAKSKPKPSPLHNIQFHFEAIGTTWLIELYRSLKTSDQKKLLHNIDVRISTFDKHYSRFRSDSLVAAMAKDAGEYVLPADARPMLDLYQDLYENTAGAFTPLIGQTLSDAGYDAAYSLMPGVLAKPPSWDSVLDYQFPKLRIKQPSLLDFGSLGKGYLVDLLSVLLEEHGIDDFCINAGGDIIHKGSEPIRIGLEHPDNITKAIGVATIQNRSLCGSAGNRRTWGDFHHIIDPRTLQSPRHIKATWVVADTAMIADGLATCLFFAVPDELRKDYNFEYAIVRDDNSLEYSTGFPGEFF